MGENDTITYSKTIKPNSYEFGKAGNRFKVYFEDAADLKKMIDELKELGFMTDEEH